MFFNEFTRDNFAERRASQLGAGVALDPESLITGEEATNGMTYDNSRRDWPSYDTYLAAIAGDIPTDEMVLWAPRVRIDQEDAISPMQQGVATDSALLAPRDIATLGAIMGALLGANAPTSHFPTVKASADEWLADATLALPIGLL